MKRHDTVPDSTLEHDTDPTTARASETTEPGGPPDGGDVDSILDGFGGRPRTYFAKHQAVSNGRNAAKYDAVASPAKAHTDPGEIAPVILATTAEEPVGRILQEASRAADARDTVPLLHVPNPPLADARRNETTSPNLRSRRSVPGCVVPAVVVSAVIVSAALYLTRSPASGPAAPTVTTPSVERPSVPGSASVSEVVPVGPSNSPSSSVPTATISATMPVPSAAALMPTARAIAAPPSSFSTRPTHSARPPDTAPSPSVPPTSSSPRGDMKRDFQ